MDRNNGRNGGRLGVRNSAGGGGRGIRNANAPNAPERVAYARGTEKSEKGRGNTDILPRAQRWKSTLQFVLLFLVCIISFAILLAMASNGLHK